MILCLQEDIKNDTMNHDCTLFTISKINHHLSSVKYYLNSSHSQITILTTETECEIDTHAKLTLINI